MAILSCSCNWLFTVLNLVSMLTMLTNIYLAISFGLRCVAWQTKKKALILVILIWFIYILLVSLLVAPLIDIDLGHSHVTEYRGEIFEQSKHFVAAAISLFLACSAIVCCLTVRSIKRWRGKREYTFINHLVTTKHCLLDAVTRLLGLLKVIGSLTSELLSLYKIKKSV